MIEVDIKSEQIAESGGHIEGKSALAGDLDSTARLIRESVQNSWDARDDERNGPVRFRVDGWDLRPDEVESLRELLPVGDLMGFSGSTSDKTGGGILHPKVALHNDPVRLLVISDRNTVGLCGPTVGGRAWEGVRHGKAMERQQQRFANFVRNKGRPSSATGGGDGGAYGIGKSALWLASQCGTVLIHTRTTDENGKSVERFIGSVIGDDFDDGEFSFTGRHFIGRESESGVIEPLEGPDAAEARKKLPIPSYDVDGQQVDGTSIVIVAPRVPPSWDPSDYWELEMGRIRDAIRWHVWPKRVPGARPHAGGTAEPDMLFDIAWNGNPVDLPAPLEDPEIHPYAKALLDCVLRRQELTINSDDPDFDRPIECHRPKRRLGELKFRRAGKSDNNVFHITLTQADLNPETDGDKRDEFDGELPVIDFNKPWGQVALIRREPLLMVRYEPIKGSDEAGNYVGVFLSAEDREVEESLTLAEPPAHDDWNAHLVPNDDRSDHRRTYVKRTIAVIRQELGQFTRSLRPHGGERVAGSGAQQVSRILTQRLIGGVGGGRIVVKPRPGTGSSGGKNPKAILHLLRSEQNGDRSVHHLSVALQNIPVGTSVALEAGGKGYDSEGSMPIDRFVNFSWADRNGIVTNGPGATIDSDDIDDLVLIVSVTGNLRVRPTVNVEVANGAA